MTLLGERIARRIARLGPLTLADYMAEALTDPEHGYYSGKDPFGARGDFVTAPEVSQMFGELIGLWCVTVWQAMGAPRDLRLVELGPGRGTLMADALRAARLAPGFLEALDIHLVEISPALRRQQALRLRGWPVTWHDGPADLPEGPAIVLANEFFDALPLRQFERATEGWCERLVTRAPRGLAGEGGKLALGLTPPSRAAGHLIPDHLAGLGPGAVAEICPAAQILCSDLAARLSTAGGALLIIDYGAAEATGKATLQAVRAHRACGILDAPGTADLSAHVDFAALAQVAREAGAAVHGPVAQHRFLTALGIEARAAALQAGATPAQAEDIRNALHRLTDPAEMGTLFKALAVTAPGLDPPAGFV